jgi:serine/threonine protein kinase
MSLSGDTALTLGVSMASIVVELHPVYEADVLYNGDVDDNALYEHLRAPTTVVTNAVYQRHVDSALYLRGIEVASGANSVVGKGSGGCVYRGMWHGSTEVALKQTSEDTLTNEQFYKEAALCKDYRHPHVVQFFGLFVEPANACHFMVMEFMHNGSLDSYLASQTQCTWPVRRQMALDVCKGMIYLHECALIHRDLAARNVLVDATGKCKVADFGLSQTLNAHSDKLYCTLPENTMAAVRWTAPEALSTQRYSYASDVWSMGVLLWELATQCEHRYPYPQLARNSDVRCAVIDERQTMDGQQDWPPGWYQWMAACWRYEPSERCTMKELYAAMTPKTEASDACRFMSDVQPDHVYENVK